MADNKKTAQQIKKEIQSFIQERDWEKFHSPKNLSMSLAIETSELMEIFQWLTTEEASVNKLTKIQRKKIEEEIADIGIYLFDLCNVLNIDISCAIENKLKLNRCKYPVKLAKGKAEKYTAYKETGNVKRRSRNN
jgi:dCTP diphosphatase